MTPKPLIWYLANYVDPLNVYLPDLFSEYADTNCTPQRTYLIRNGLAPVPPCGMNALQSLYNDWCPKADMMLQNLYQQGQERLLVTRADMENSNMSETLIKAMLQMPHGMKAGFCPNTPPTERLWGWFG